MSDDKLMVRLEKHMSKKDMELARSRVIELRSQGNTANLGEITSLLRSEFPEISESLISQIEESPDYVQRVLQKQMGKVAAAIPEIMDVLITKARSGDNNAINQLKELSGLSKKIIAVQTNIQNNFSLKGQSDDYIDAQYRELAAELD